MTLSSTVSSLSRLVELRAHEVEAATAELARRHDLARRMRHSLDRMHDLLREVGRHTAGSAVLASNSAHYKASLVDMIAAHRRELARQNDLVEAARHALDQARLRHERLTRTLDAQRTVLRRELQTRDQKRQDQLALQSWVHARCIPSF